MVRPRGPVRHWGGRRPALGRVDEGALVVAVGRPAARGCGSAPLSRAAMQLGHLRGSVRLTPLAVMRAGAGDPRGMGW